MKRIAFITLFITMLLSASAQNDKTYFYGVDFSMVKAVGVSESVADFTKAFKGINILFASESAKYDFSKVYGSPVTNYPDMMIEDAGLNDYSDMIAYHYDEEAIDLAEYVKEMDWPHDSGKGIILIAKALDKGKGYAIYDIVLFDLAKREILMSKEVSGKAMGFGLRNFWARTVYELTFDYSLFD